MLWDSPNVKSGKEKSTGQIGTPEEMTTTFCYMVSIEASFINGTALVVGGGRLATLSLFYI